MAAPSSDTYSITPPLRVYPSAEEAEEAIHAWTKEHCYNLSRKGVETIESKEVMLWRFECDRSGKSKSTSQLSSADRVRKKRGSKRIRCPVRLRIVAVDANNATGAWWVEYTKDGSRNRNPPPSQDVRVHMAHRQRAAERSAAKKMSTLQPSLERRPGWSANIEDIRCNAANFSWLAGYPERHLQCQE